MKEKDMNILFVINDLSFAGHASIEYLSAVAKMEGCNTYFCSIDRDSLKEYMEKINPDIVAYSANVIGYENIVKENNKIKDKFNYVSIMGGPYPTVFQNDFKSSGMDAFCVGEGEGAFKDFIIRVKEDKSFDDVSNLITSKGVNPVRNLIKNLDDIPFPDKDIILNNTFLGDVSKKTFYTTRGCPFKCNYCCNNYYHKLYDGKGKFVRRFGVERIIEEMQYVKSKYRMDFVRIGDDLFTMKVDDWLVEFARMYKKYINIPFSCFLRFDRVDDDLLKLLKDMGCYSVLLSVDSTNSYVREKILNRHMNKDVDISNNLRKIRSYGINTWVNYMLAAPCSTLQDDLDSFKFNRSGNITYPHYSTTDPMVGTALFDYCVEHDLISKDYKGIMTHEHSNLNCFSKREKTIRHNIYCYGAFINILPFPFDRVIGELIKYMPDIKFNKVFRDFLHNHYQTRKIFKVKC